LEAIPMSKSEEESEVLEEFVLVLLCMLSREEKGSPDFFVTRSWKSYSFDILDSLAEKDYVSSSAGAKSVTITKERLKRASELNKKIFSVLKDTYEKKSGIWLCLLGNPSPVSKKYVFTLTCPKRRP
jgi:hypothetical protein